MSVDVHVFLLFNLYSSILCITNLLLQVHVIHSAADLPIDVAINLFDKKKSKNNYVSLGLCKACMNGSKDVMEVLHDCDSNKEQVLNMIPDQDLPPLCWYAFRLTQVRERERFCSCNCDCIENCFFTYGVRWGRLKESKVHFFGREEEKLRTPHKTTGCYL